MEYNDKNVCHQQFGTDMLNSIYKTQLSLLNFRSDMLNSIYKHNCRSQYN